MRSKHFSNDYLLHRQMQPKTTALKMWRMQFLPVMLLLALSFVKGLAQCPTPTFIVGSNAGNGIDRLSLADPAMLNMTGGRVEIRGTFRADFGTWVLKGVDVVLSDNSSAIFVEGNSVLDASTNPNGAIPTQFHVCGDATVWAGITCNFLGTIKLDGCNISNACSAITLNVGSSIQITNNNFLANRVCITANGSINTIGGGIAHNIFDHTGTDTTCLELSRAFVLTNVKFIQIGDQVQAGLPNRIVGYPIGIKGTNSNVDLYNTTFLNGGWAIDLKGSGVTVDLNIHGLGGSATSTPIIQGFELGGIKVVNVNLSVQDARITTTAYEVQNIENTLPAVINIQRCFFESYSDRGVFLGSSVYSGINILNCTFRDNNTSPDYREGVRLQFCQLASKNATANISNNEFFDDLKIHPTPSPLHITAGAYIVSSAKIKINSNAFFQNYSTTAEHEYKGVSLFNSDQCEVVNNTFTGNNGPAPATNVYYYRGLDNNSSSFSKVQCNYAQDLNAGIYFNGSGSNGATLQMNELSDNLDDLLLDEATIIGQQKGLNNRWPSNSPMEARFAGAPSSSLLEMSQFEINSADDGSNLWPNPRTPDGDDWFKQAPLPFPLIQICGQQPPIDGGPRLTKASQMVINGTFTPFRGYAATTFDATLFAYRELSEHPEWRLESSPEARFFSRQDNLNVGKLQRAKNAWDNLSLFPTSFETSWDANKRAISQKLDEIRSKIAELGTTQSPEKQNQLAQAIAALDAELTILQQQNATLSTQYIAERNERAFRLTLDLAAITPDNVWENNLKTVLELFALRHLSATGEWNDEQQAAMQSIADQCRHEGGCGVVLARAALDNNNYDDDAMCPALLERKVDNRPETSFARISPNPANERCQIRFAGLATGELIISDLQGKVLQNVRVKNVTQTDLDTSNLPNGLFFVQLVTDQHIKWTDKLVIVR